MPTITNNKNLPESVVRAIRNDEYSKGDADYSCTDLIAPTRITILKARHGDEIVEDAVDCIWRVLGKLGHKLLEQAGADNALLEERLFAEVLGRKISGASDVGQWVYEDGKITDYKFTTVWTAIFKDRYNDWIAQQNIYAWFFRRYGFEINELELCCIYRDWRKNESLQRNDYPPNAQIIKLAVWPDIECENFIKRNLQSLIYAEQIDDSELPECTPDDMWQKPTRWALKREGRKTAIRVFASLADAQKGQANEKKQVGLFIEERLGSRPRCEDYCAVNRWCNQFQAYSAEQDAAKAAKAENESTPAESAQDKSAPKMSDADLLDTPLPTYK